MNKYFSLLQAASKILLESESKQNYGDYSQPPSISVYELKIIIAIMLNEENTDSKWFFTQIPLTEQRNFLHDASHFIKNNRSWNSALEASILDDKKKGKKINDDNKKGKESYTNNQKNGNYKALWVRWKTIKRLLGNIWALKETQRKELINGLLQLQSDEDFVQLIEYVSAMFPSHQARVLVELSTLLQDSKLTTLIAEQGRGINAIYPQTSTQQSLIIPAVQIMSSILTWSFALCREFNHDIPTVEPYRIMYLLLALPAEISSKIRLEMEKEYSSGNSIEKDSDNVESVFYSELFGIAPIQWSDVGKIAAKIRSIWLWLSAIGLNHRGDKFWAITCQLMNNASRLFGEQLLSHLQLANAFRRISDQTATGIEMKSSEEQAHSSHEVSISTNHHWMNVLKKLMEKTYDSLTTEQIGHFVSVMRNDRANLRLSDISIMVDLLAKNIDFFELARDNELEVS